MDALMALIVIANLLALFYLLLLHLPMVLFRIIQKARRGEPLQADAVALVSLILAFGVTGWIERRGWPTWVVYYVPFGIILLVFDWVIGTALFMWARVRVGPT
jgi:hypothetical protein